MTYVCTLCGSEIKNIEKRTHECMPMLKQIIDKKDLEIEHLKKLLGAE